MRADLFSVFVNKIAGRIAFSGVLLHEADVIAVGHETDVLTVMLARVAEALLFRHLAYLCLAVCAERKDRVRELMLREVVEDITLILALVHAFFQDIPAGVLIALNARIVSGHDVV